MMNLPLPSLHPSINSPLRTALLRSVVVTYACKSDELFSEMVVVVETNYGRKEI